MKKVCIISLSENTQIYDLVKKQTIEPLVKKNWPKVQHPR